MTNIFVTGGNGFIGSHLFKEFQNDEAHFFALILPNEKPMLSDTRISWIFGDLNQRETYIDALSQCQMVIHMAAELHNPARFELINVLGVETLAEAAKSCNINRFIHLSSVGVVGAQFSTSPIVIDELADCFPKNEYERTKLESERILQRHFSEKELVILRPTNVFGDGHPRKHLLNWIQYITKQKTVVFSPNTLVNYVYVKDVTATIAFFASNDPCYGVYNIGKSMTLDSFIDATALHCNVRARKIKIHPSILKGFLLIKRFLPNSISLKLLSLLNRVSYSHKKLECIFKLPYGTEEGLKNTIQYFKKLEDQND